MPATNLSVAEKRRQMQEFMANASARREPIVGITKDDLQQTINRIDNRIVALLDQIETAEPTLTERQRTDLVSLNLDVRQARF